MRRIVFWSVQVTQYFTYFMADFSIVQFLQNHKALMQDHLPLRQCTRMVSRATWASEELQNHAAEMFLLQVFFFGIYHYLILSRCDWVLASVVELNRLVDVHRHL